MGYQMKKKKLSFQKFGIAFVNKVNVRSKEFMLSFKSTLAILGERMQKLLSP